MKLVRFGGKKCAKLCKILFVFLAFFSTYSPFLGAALAATSPFTQTNWSGGSGQTAFTDNTKFDSSLSVTTSTAGESSLTPTEKFSNTGFESDLTGWSTHIGGSFSDSSFAGTSGAVAAWPLDDTTTTQSYSRVVNPADSEGRNIVINGDFASDTIWTKGTGWTISGGVASKSTGTAANLTQTSLPITIGRAYSATFTVSNYSAGSALITVGNASGTARSANGTYTQILIAATNANVTIFGDASFVGDIDNVIVTQLNIPAYNATPTQLLSDGDMEASGTSSWTAGNSATLSKQTSNPYGGTQVLRVAYNGSPLAQAVQTVFTTGQVYRISGYARSDGAAIPSVNGTAAVWTGTSSTTWQPFDIVYIAGDTAIRLRNNTSSGYVEFDNVVVSLDTGIRQGELALDTGIETWTNSTTPTYWTKATAGTSTVNQETSVVHGGSSAVRFEVDSSNNFASISQNWLVVGKTYTVSLWAKADSAGSSMLAITGTANYLLPSLTTSYALYTVTFVADNTILTIKRNSATSRTIYVDDITVTEVSPLVGRNTNGVTVGATASGHLTKAYNFDGTNDFINIYSSDLNSAFNPSEGTLIAWAKVSGSGVWSDGTSRYIATLYSSSSNSVNIFKSSTSGYLIYSYVANGTTTNTQLSGQSSTGWMQVAVTWNKSSDQFKTYLNGSQVGSTQTGLGTWSGNLSSTNVAIGANASTGTGPWSGMINDVRLYNRALTSSEISALYSGATLTRDTTTTYSSSTGSLKVVSPSDQSTVIKQSVNVGDTSSYNLIAYARTDGSAVTSADASLVANGVAVSTTYTSVGSGWYKLSGTVTGVATSVDYGVQVEAGKTVYLDNISLANYPTSGTLTSSIFDTGFASNFGTLTYNATTPTNTTATIKIRTSNDSGMSGATAFSSCTAISSGSDVSNNSCVTDGHRYVQYFATLTTSDLLVTPTLLDVSLTFSNAVSPTGSISISGGDPSVKSTSTTLTLTASDDLDSSSSIEMQIANTADFTGASYETFSASKSWSLTTEDGTKTVYVRFRDSNSNVSQTYSDTIVLDTTSPASVSLVGPDDNVDTNNERPTFKWKTTTDSSSGLSKYVFQLRNSNGTSFEIGDIPISGTSEIVTPKYTIYFDNFSDSDSGNDSISLYTKSTTAWGSNENDGKISEGSATWTVKAFDIAGNEVASSRSLYLDRSVPGLATSLENEGETNSYLSTTSTSPKLTGNATDDHHLKRIEVHYYKQDIFLGIVTRESLVVTKSLVRDSTNDSTKTNWSFDITPSAQLEYGKYHILAKSIDTAGNESSTHQYYLSISPELTYANDETPISKITQIEVPVKISIPELEKQVIIHKEMEATELSNLLDELKSSLSFVWGIPSRMIDQISRAAVLAQEQTIRLTITISDNTRRFVAGATVMTSRLISDASLALEGSYDLFMQRLQSIRPPTIQRPNIAFNLPQIQLPQLTLSLPPLPKVPAPNIKLVALPKIDLPPISAPSVVLPKVDIPSSSEIISSSRSVADSFNTPISNAKAGVDKQLKSISTYTRDTLVVQGEKVQDVSTKVWSDFESEQDKKIESIRQLWRGDRIPLAINLVLTESKKPVVATQNFFHKVRISYDTVVAIMFDDKPTVITDVTIEEVGEDYAIVTYKTNHRAWGKVNYGSTLSYGQEVMLPEREFVHRAKLTGLKPGGKYFFEVMAQNKNYAYDAYYVLEIPVKK